MYYPVMETSVPQVIAIAVAAATLWRLVHFLGLRSSLSHIPGPRGISWWRGSFDQFFSPDGWAFHEELYRNYGGAVRLDMLFGEQRLYVTDPLALHHILVKDQDVYEETEEFLLVFRLIMGPSLLATLGDHHKRQRKMLNPIFSLKHMRDLLPICYPIAHKLCGALGSEVTKGKEPIDVMNWMSRAALEYIGQAGFGYSFDALDDKQTNEYSEAMKSFLPAMTKLTFLRQLLPLGAKLGPASLRRRLLQLIPSRSVEDIVMLTDTLEKNSKSILQGKRQALEDGDEAVHAQIGKGKDILSVLMKANSGISGATTVPEEELLSHMSTFISAGHDTTTSAVSRILHVLSTHQDVQSKLREEVTAARKEQGDLDYDALMALPLLDAICRETLRVYPPALQVIRMHIDRTKKDAVLPLLWPIKSADGKTEIKEIPLKKDTTIHISILGANRSKAIWGDDADEWKPERWLKPLPKSVDDAHLPGVYSQMMTFIGGGRACIGFKFSEMEMKMVLSMLFEKFVFEPGPEIAWKMGAIHHPVVKDSGSDAGQVPLKVSFVQS